jgi:hypothetical protein
LGVRLTTHLHLVPRLKISGTIPPINLFMAIQSFLGPWPLFSFLILYRISKTPWTEDQPVARPLPIQKTTQTQNKRTKTPIPRVRSEPTISVPERAKTVHALDRVATVTSRNYISTSRIFSWHGI